MPLAHLGNKKYYLGMFFKVIIEDIMWIMMMLWWWVNTSFVCLFDMNAQNFVQLPFLEFIQHPKGEAPKKGIISFTNARTKQMKQAQKLVQVDALETLCNTL